LTRDTSVARFTRDPLARDRRGTYVARNSPQHRSINNARLSHIAGDTMGQRSGRTLVRATGALVILGAMTLSAPAWSQGIESLGIPYDRQLTLDRKLPESPASRYVRITQAGAVRTLDGPALHVRVTNITDEPIHVAVAFDPPGQAADCTEAADLDPAIGQRYVCPQPMIRSGVRYPVTIEVRTTGKRAPVERIRQTYRFGKDHLAALAGRPGGRLAG
jgi:hypothetical protein